METVIFCVILTAGVIGIFVNNKIQSSLLLRRLYCIWVAIIILIALFTFNPWGIIGQ